LGAAGTELSAKAPEKQVVADSTGAPDGAIPPRFDPDLAKVANAWPKLSADAKSAIMAIVEGGAKQG